MNKIIRYKAQNYVIREKQMTFETPFGAVTVINGINYIYLNACMDLMDKQKILHKILTGFNRSGKSKLHGGLGVKMQAIRKSNNGYVKWECN